MTETAPTKQGTPRTPTDDELPGLLKELEAVGGPVSAFARARGLAAWKLYEVRQGRRGLVRCTRGKAKRRNLVPVKVVDRASSPAPVPTPALELWLSGGHRLLVPAGFDESALRRLMGVLATC